MNGARESGGRSAAALITAGVVTTAAERPHRSSTNAVP
jgi:hypothetical protein